MKKVAIIGAGFAGLFAAALLAQRGFSVTLFEQHYRLGGYGDSFKRKGYQFHTSIYRVPKKWNRLLELVDIHFEKDEKIYGSCRYIFSDGQSIVPGGDLSKKLIELFPEEEQKISHFFERMHQIGEVFGKIYMSGNSMKDLKLSEAKDYLEVANATIGTILTTYFGENKKLKDIIKATLDFEDDTIALVIPVTLLEIKADEKDELPYGGAPVIIKRLKEKIKQYGGTIRLQENVLAMDVSNEGYCTKMVTNKGEYTDFDQFLIASDINNFYNSIINEKYSHPFLKENFHISNATFSVWVGLKCAYEQLGLSESTIYYQMKEQDWYMKSINKELEISSDFLFISSLFSQDPNSTKKGKSQLCIGLATEIGPFEEARANNQYEQLKQEITDKIINIVADIFPNMVPEIEIIESASPLTYKRYTLNARGATIGYQKKKSFIMSKNRHKNINPKLKNIYFGSQWTSILGGMIGSMEEGVKAVNLILHTYKDEPYAYMEKLM